MHVIKTSFESSVHNICAELAQEEVKALACKSVASIVTFPAYALATRVIAVAAHIFWTANEVVLFLPRMISLTVGLAVSEKASLSREYFQRAAHVYGLYFKTLGAQFTLGTAACIVPEFSHYLLELHKPLFTLQLDTFIQTLPDLPHVQKDIRKGCNVIDSVIALYRRLGLTDDDWRQALTTAIRDTYRSNPQSGPDYLNTESQVFQEAFKRTLFFFISFSLNEKQAKGELNAELIDGLHPDIWRNMRDYLEPDTQIQLLNLLKDTIIDSEVNPHFLRLYKFFTGFEYRNVNSTTVMRSLLDCMIEAKDALIRNKKFTKDDVESYMALSPTTLDGIVRLLTKANLVGDDITFGNVTFTEDFHFFGAKAMLVECARAVKALTQGEKAALYELCCNTDGVQQSQNVKLAFRLLQQLKMEIIDKKMNNSDLDKDSTIDWSLMAC